MKKKMYKSKKNWVVASVVGLSFLGGNLVKAEDVPTNEATNEIVVIQQTADPTDNSQETVSPTPAETVNQEMTVSGDQTTPVQLVTTESDKEVVVNGVSDEVVETPLQTENETLAPVVQDNKMETVPVVTEVQAKDTATTSLSAVAASTTLPLTSANVMDGKIHIKYNHPLNPGEKIKFAVWSDVNKQDDLIWYNADANASLIVDLGKHRDYGIYHIHTYNQYQGLNALKITIPKPEILTEIIKQSATSYDIMIRNVPNNISFVKVPVWSKLNNQDDLIWYTATKTDTTTYKVNVQLSKHHNNTGEYSAHIYGFDKYLNKLIGLSSSAGFSVATPQNATVTIVNYDQNNPTFEVIVSGTKDTKMISSVSVAVWSEDKDQDDLVWYKPTIANNQAKVTIDIKNHSNLSDNYLVHVYTNYTDGSKVGTNLGSYKIENNQPVINKIHANLTTSGIAIALESNTVATNAQIKYAVWSDANKQDDLKWYTADASGRVLANYENHKDFGLYNIHAYQLRDGKMIGLTTATITIPSPHVSATIQQKSPSTYQVSITNVPLYISEVLVPTWSKLNDQDDILWGKAIKDAVGNYTALIDLRDHQFDLGEYAVHVYGKSRIGKQTIGLTSQGFVVDAQSNIPKNTIQQSVNYIVLNHVPSKGVVDFVFSQKASDKAIRAVKLDVWSQENKSNLSTYNASSIINGNLSLSVNQINHRGVKGNYYVNALVTFADGTVENKALGNYILNASYDIPYYNQKDPRWGNKTYGYYTMGASGCVPTSLAMIFSSLSGKAVLPPQVADFLYYSTNDFNKSEIGTTTTGLLKAVSHFGYQSTNLITQTDLISALKAGFHVAGAIQYNKFVGNGSHEMVYKGYQNGNTYVYDPYTQRYCGWYPVANLWNERSTFTSDNLGVSAPFFKITNYI
ncbi:GBS Bsp-like repeat-containing protein [Streptococcus parauberis]|uniref:GBS Bsp-like repeat-containing protein n=1 Tax=Streptococcus parauberis TaxID=1348 RepID=UPI00031C0303|nr:GBS Bsp-like repeat-containing protein [Streptococcus parauberis]UWM90089.1 GBS Bsp-like repeat-containing protein [Streptococcus parauberis]GAJ61478.1 autolysin [Streptococcus parauberis]